MLRTALLLCLPFVALTADLHLKKTDRIYGGTEVQPNSAPFMVALRSKKSRGGTFCGGAIVSKRFILTAARCVYGAQSVEIIAGAHDLSTMENSQKRYITSYITIHEEYKKKSIKNDIALVQFPKPVRLQGNMMKVNMLKLSQKDIDLVGQTGQVYGWGGDGLQPSDKLQMTNLEVQPIKKCQETYMNSLTDKQMCTKGDKKNFCNGDQGGPLVIDGKLVGIMSTPYNNGCEYDEPTIVTRASKYLDWIQKNSDVKFEE